MEFTEQTAGGGTPRQRRYPGCRRTLVEWEGRGGGDDRHRSMRRPQAAAASAVVVGWDFSSRSRF